MIYQSLAVVLTRKPYRETSWLLDVFTYEHGRLTLIAKGARKARRDVVIEPFQLLSLSWSQKNDLGLLLTVELQGHRRVLQGKQLWLGFYLNELIIKLFPRHIIEPELFEALQTTLAALSAPQLDENTLRYFELAVLHALGLLPDLSYDEQGQVIKAELFYRFMPEQTLQQLDEGVNCHSKVSGELIRALAERHIPEHLRLVARQVMRRFIHHALGGRTLNSRHYFMQLGLHKSD